jgi:YesN/AraC family two-component response regulator
MEVNKPFLKEDVTMDDLCRALFTNKVYLSKVIRTCTSYNFSQFMNLYRVKYATSIYRDDMSLRMSDLAALAGFRNMVSFNMAFRLFFDMTPGDWARMCRAEKAASSKDGPPRLSSSRGQGR